MPSDQPVPSAPVERRRDLWGVLTLICLDAEWADVQSDEDCTPFRIPRAMWEAMPHA